MATTKTPEPLIRPYRYKPEVTVAARQGNTYVKPQQTQIGSPIGPTSLEHLASSLRSISPVLMGYFEKKEKDKQEQLIAEGERLQKESAVSDWTEAVKKKPELEKYSPFVREGFEKQASISLGAQYQLHLQDLMTKDEKLASMTDQKEIEAYISQDQAEWLKANTSHINDKAIAEQLIPKMNEARAYFGYQYSEKQLKQQVEDKYNAFASGIQSSVQAMMVGNEETINKGGDAADALASQTAAQISLHAQNTILDASNPKKVNDAIMVALESLIKNTPADKQDFINKVISRITTKGSAKLSGIMEYQKKIDEWKTTASHNYLLSEQVKKVKREEEARASVQELSIKMFKNPTGNFTAEIANIAAKYGKEAGDELTVRSKSLLAGVAQRKSFYEAGSGGGGGVSFAKSATQYGYYKKAMAGTLTEKDLDYCVVNKIFTPLQATSLLENLGKPDKQGLALVNAGMSILGYGKDYNPTSVEAAQQYTSMGQSLLDTAMEVKQELITKNGRAPTATEYQDAFWKKLKAIQEVEASKKTSPVAKKITSTPAKDISYNPLGHTLQWMGLKGASPLLTKEGTPDTPLMMGLITDYQTNGANSKLAESARRQGAVGTEVDRWVQTLVSTWGIPIKVKDKKK